MTRRVPMLAAVAVLGGLAVAGVASGAQPGMPADADSPSPHGAMRTPEVDPAGRLRAVLQLRPAQEPALQAFAGAMKAGREARPDHSGVAPPATTPERIAFMERRMSERMTRAHERNVALLRFYDQLDPAQKKAFDAMTMGHGGGMQPLWKRGRPGMGHMHGGEHAGPPPAAE